MDCDINLSVEMSVQQKILVIWYLRFVPPGLSMSQIRGICDQLYLYLGPNFVTFESLVFKIWYLVYQDVPSIEQPLYSTL